MFVRRHGSDRFPKESNIFKVLKDAKLDDQERINGIKNALARGDNLAVKTFIYNASVLHEACRYGGPVLLSWLMEQARDLFDAKTAKGTPVLFFAAKYGNQNAIQFFLDKYPEQALQQIKAINKTSETINAYATMGGNIELLEKMNKVRGDALFYTESKDIADNLFAIMNKIAVNKCLAMLKYLFIHYSKIFAAKESEFFCETLKHGWAEGADYFITQRKINLQSIPAAMNDAAEGGSEAIVKQLIEHKANFKTSSSSAGYSPLHSAAFRERTAVVKLLLEHKADPNQENERKENAVHISARECDFKTLELLVQKGGKCNVGRYGTPLDFFIRGYQGRQDQDHKPGLSFLFKQQNINPRIRFSNGQTWAHVAAANSHDQLLENLHLLGADYFSIKDQNGLLPIHFAAQGDFATDEMKATTFLLKINPEFLETPDNAGHTPLAYAACNANSKAVRFLLQKGANCYAVNRQGITAAAQILLTNERFQSSQLEVLILLYDDHFLSYRSILVDLFDRLLISQRLTLLIRMLIEHDPTEDRLNTILSIFKESNTKDFFGESKETILQIAQNQRTELLKLAATKEGPDLAARIRSVFLDYEYDFFNVDFGLRLQQAIGLESTTADKGDSKSESRGFKM